MKKPLLIFFAAICTGYAFWSCEKDDICPDETPTTPSLVIEFYDEGNRSLAKNVNGLSIHAEGRNNYVRLNDTGDTIVSDVSTIKIPLKTDADSVQYIFTLNTGNTPENTGDDANENIVTFNYIRNEVYVSRACGFKTLYTLNSNGLTGVVPGIIADTENIPWILETEIIKTNIEDENEEHIRIYF